MRKITLLMALALIISAVNAQQMRNAPRIPVGTKITNQMIQGYDGNIALARFIDSAETPSKAPGDVLMDEGFESTSGTAVPTGWTVSQNSGAGWVTVGNGTNNIPGVTGTVAPHAGSRMLALSWQDSGLNSWAFSKGLTFTAGITYVINFWYMMPGYAGPPQEYSGLEVKIGQTATSAGMGSATSLFSNTTTLIAKWTQVTATFTPTVDGTYYLGFHDITPGTQMGLYTVIDDVKVNEYDPNYNPPTELITSSWGGVFSATDASVLGIAYAKNFNYYGLASGVASAEWSFNSTATNVLPPVNNITALMYNISGEQSATFVVTGLDGNDYSVINTRNIQMPSAGFSDWVWNFLPEETQLSIYTASTNNYLIGLNSYYNVVGEHFEIPANTTVTLSAISFLPVYYTISTANRTKTVPIKVYKEDPATGLPGTVLGTYSPTFSALFGNTTINGVITEKTYTLTTPLQITGNFFISIDFSGMGTSGTTTNKIGLASAKSRLFPYSTSYCFYQSAWYNTDEFWIDYESSSSIIPQITANPVAVTDAAVTAITAPATSGCFTTTESVTAEITNFGTATITDIDLELVVDNVVLQLAQLHGLSIAPTATYTYTFTTTADLSANGNHTIRVNSYYTGDQDATNNFKEITVVTGCTNTIVNQTEKVKIYPNPVKDNVVIENAFGSHARIYDISGKVVFETNITNVTQSVNISSMSAGVYFIELQNNNSVSRVKLIKQ